jgi:signal transduction histidine kinase
MILRLALGGLLALAALLAAVEALRARRRVDLLGHLPVTLMRVNRTGERLWARDANGNAGDRMPDRIGAALPGSGQTSIVVEPGGRQYSLTGLPGGGALVTAQDADPLVLRRAERLAEMVAGLAHELNTPLATATLTLTSLAATPLTDDAGAKLATARAQLDRVAALTAGLADLTSLRLRPAAPAKVPVAALLEEAAVAAHAEATSRGVQLQLDRPPQAAQVRVARHDMVRALTNLTLNAVRHGSVAGDTVRLGAHVTRDEVTLQVSDDGAGFPPDALDALSRPWERAADSPGSGLGLAVVREVLDAHATTLVATRSTEGPVRRFTLSFGLPRLDAP